VLTPNYEMVGLCREVDGSLHQLAGRQRWRRRCRGGRGAHRRRDTVPSGTLYRL